MIAAPTPNPPYSLVSGGGTATIGPGQSEPIVVQFKPTAASATALAGSLPVTSSDPNHPSASVALSGRARQNPSRNEKLRPVIARSGATKQSRSDGAQRPEIASLRSQ